MNFFGRIIILNKYSSTNSHTQKQIDKGIEYPVGWSRHVIVPK